MSEFTHASRRRLLTLVNSIDRAALKADRVRLVTLTYPKVFPTPRESKVHLAAIVKRFRRAWGQAAIIWKLEPQKRGAPHYHLLVFMDSPHTLQDERDWWARNWYEVVDSGDKLHLKAGTGVEQIREWNGVTAYAAKYLCKPASSAGWENPGRWWGVYGRDKLPVALEEIETTETKALKLRRLMIRWYEHQPSGRFRVQTAAGNRRQHVQRLFLDRLGLEACRQADMRVRPYHRRWKFSRGGCSMFVPEDVTRRLMTLVGLPGGG